jgi:hypothetical protein
LVSLISPPLEALAFELGEVDAVGGVGDVEVQDGPDEREAAGLAGEPEETRAIPLSAHSAPQPSDARTVEIVGAVSEVVERRAHGREQSAERALGLTSAR